jgi:hypothetical protein|tara:strand:- start:118 stop:228 length:111 start_codon:yes stop_codon:yes gene_type:complete
MEIDLKIILVMWIVGIALLSIQITRDRKEFNKDYEK